MLAGRRVDWSLGMAIFLFCNRASRARRWHRRTRSTEEACPGLSGVTAISATDDVLGLPTALFYVGTSAVVSTLWPLDDVNGAAFATEFYRHFFEQQARLSAAENIGGIFGGYLNLAS